MKLKGFFFCLFSDVKHDLESAQVGILYAASVFLPDSICSMQLDAASVKK